MNDDRPFCLMASWGPDEIGAQLKDSALERTQSLYALFAGLGIYLKRLARKIRAESVTSEQAGRSEWRKSFRR